MTGYENKWVNYYADPEERVPRMFDPDHPVLDDEDDFYDEEEYDEQSRDQWYRNRRDNCYFYCCMVCNMCQDG